MRELVRQHAALLLEGNETRLVEVVERLLVEVLEVVEVVEGMLGSGSVGARGAEATGNIIAGGVRSSRRDWIVPVTNPASSATFHTRSEAAGSSRRRRVTSQAMPSSTVLWMT